MTKITLNFNERYENAIPASVVHPGIYVVFAYNNDSANPNWVLLDIGEAENIYERHCHHERANLWVNYAHEHGMILVYYVAEIGNEHEHRKIAEAALLFRFQPLISSDGKQGYHHGDVELTVTGRLQTAFGAFVQRNTDV